MKQPYDATISPDCDTLNACERLIERYAPGLMRAGGGGLGRDMPHCAPQKPNPATVARNTEIIRLALTGEYTKADISRKMKVGETEVSGVLNRADVKAKPGVPGRKVTKL